MTRHPAPPKLFIVIDPSGFPDGYPMLSRKRAEDHKRLCRNGSRIIRYAPIPPKPRKPKRPAKKGRR